MTTKQTLEQEQEIRFQKLGNRWYVFAETDEQELVYCVLPPGIDPFSQKFEFYSDLKAQLEKTKKKANLSRIA